MAVLLYLAAPVLVIVVCSVVTALWGRRAPSTEEAIADFSRELRALAPPRRQGGRRGGRAVGGTRSG